MKRLVLVDGNALLHRAYHALPPMTTSKGELVNAVYGFSSMLLKTLADLKPDFMAITWDEKGPTFRHQTYTQYKATRGPADEGLSNQYERVYQVTKALNIPEFSLSGYEADDLIGTLARQALRQGHSAELSRSPQGQQEKDRLEVIILTGDRDIMQVIDKNIKVLMPRKTLQDVGLYGVEEFTQRYGFSPKQLVDYKALAGDQSDNIPGVSGIGEVTATKLVKEFGSVEKIFQPKNLKTLPERMQKLLAEGAESASLSKGLATLDLNAPIKLNLSQCRVHDFDHQRVVKLFEELEFKSLINRLPSSAQGPAGSQPHPTSSLVATSLRALDGAPRSPSPLASQPPHTTDLDLKVEKVLQKMSRIGILIDLKFLGRLGKGLKLKLKALEKNIYSKVGHQFNINSPKQLSEILFDELRLPVVRKTKTGRSTDEATLRELVGDHPIIELLLEYRQLFKLISTYVDALPKFVGQDGRIHSTFNVEGAATGRLSSQDPNLQNIPIKGQIGGEIRKAFIASKGRILLGADYSQIELRIMAYLADDPGLKKAFQEGLDIHSATASKIFKVPVDQVSKQQRMVGKTMNFATLYGQGPHALSRQLGVEYELAKLYIFEYFEQFPKVREWMQKTLEKAYQDGFVQTLWGRKRYIPELASSNRMFKAQGERAAINHPVQGTAADMIKKAMVEINKSLESRVPTKSRLASGGKSQGKQKPRLKTLATSDCSMILQVHDELLFECDPKGVEEIAKMVKEKMENSLKLSVPVKVDLKVGKNWGEMTPLKI